MFVRGDSIKTIRQFVITDSGIVVGERFEGVEAILSGMPREAVRNAVSVSLEGSDGPASPEDAVRPDEQPDRVLIAEDEFAIADLLERALTDEGYRVVTASNGRQGLERLAEEPCRIS